MKLLKDDPDLLESKRKFITFYDDESGKSRGLFSRCLREALHEIGDNADLSPYNCMYMNLTFNMTMKYIGPFWFGLATLEGKKTLYGDKRH